MTIFDNDSGDHSKESLDAFVEELRSKSDKESGRKEKKLDSTEKFK